MKKTLFALTAALLLSVPACCFGPRHGGPGGPGGCGCKCRHQAADCPQKDCPQGTPDCQKGQGGAPTPCPQHQPSAK